MSEQEKLVVDIKQAAIKALNTVIEELGSGDAIVDTFNVCAEKYETPPEAGHRSYALTGKHTFMLTWWKPEKK